MKPSSKKKGNKKKRKPSSPSPPQPAGHEIPASTNKSQPNDLEEEEDEGKTLAWLLDVFSSLSVHQITSTYVQAGRDPFKAAGILAAELDDPGESVEAGAEKPAPAESSRRQQKRVPVVAAATGMVSSVIGKGYVAEGKRGGCVFVKGTKKDRKYSVEEGEEFLCSMLGFDSELNMGVVRDVLGQCGYDVEKALDALLDISNSSCKQHMFTDERPDSTYHPFEKEQEFLQSVGNSSSLEEQQMPRTKTVNPDLQQKVLESLFNIPDYPKHQPKSMDWKKVVKHVESFGQGLEFSFSSTEELPLTAKNGKGDDYLVCRSVARKHWDTMRAYYQTAALAYSKGDRAHAAVLSEKGKLHSKLASEADEKASREIFEARNKNIKNTVTIDLHGQHVKQAIGLLKLHLLLFTYIPSIQFLKVITGCGVDGPGKGRLKCSVVSLVEKEGIEWCEENAGKLLIRLDGLKEYSFVEEEDDDSE